MAPMIETGKKEFVWCETKGFIADLIEYRDFGWFCWGCEKKIERGY